MKRALMLSCLVALGCAGGQWEAPAVDPSPPPPLDPGKTADSDDVDALLGDDDGPDTPSDARAAIVARWLAADPARGRAVGLREHDGKVADYSRAGIDRTIALLAEAKREVAALDTSDADAALDAAILRSHLELELFNLEVRQTWATDPNFYSELFDVSAYVDFAYAPLPERAAKLVAHQEAALPQVEHVLANLRPVLSKPVLETAIKIYRGYAEYLRGDVAKLLGGVGDASLQARFGKSNAALAKAADTIADRLSAEWLPRADQDSHVLGEARYLDFVAAQEGRRYTLAELEKLADEDLQRNKQRYQRLASRVRPTRPAANELLAAATKIMDASRAFIVEKRLATIPSEDRCVLRESPPYQRWNAAFLNMAGPYDEADEAFYYITLPDPSWPEKEQREYIFPWGVLQATTVHEVYPGHFLHGLWIERAPTQVQKIFESYSFTEGWAHYTEQLMIEEGFGADDPQNHLGQLSDALLRNCRFVVSIGVHAKGMSLDTAAKHFREDCFQDAASARQQAVRATFDPGYFAYTLGKLQILELREELKTELGDGFELRRFHDALLSHGSPPVALVRERVKQALR